MGRFLGFADHLTDEELRAQAAKAGYSELPTGRMERLKFVKRLRVVTVFDDNTVLG